MKKFTTAVLTLLLVLLFPVSNVLATVDMHSIDLEVRLQDDGSAIVRETRSFYTDEGTENFISMGNMGRTELLDVKVYDKQGNELERVDPWNVDASREEKAGKYGVIDTGDGYEICYGFGDYGEHTFVTEYKLTNFVFNLQDDYQAFYWKFLNDGMNPTGSASVKIYNDIGLVYEYPSTRIWGFGYDGQTQISSDHLYAYTESSMSSNNYMVILSIFEGWPFNTTNDQTWTSEGLIDRAMEGATPSDGGGGESNNQVASSPEGFIETVKSIPDKRLIAAFFLIPLLLVLGPLLLVSLIYKLIRKRQKTMVKIGDTHLKLEDIPYYREVPYDDFAKTYDLTNFKMSNVLSAYILKWIFEGRLKDKKEEVGLIFKKDSLSLEIRDKGELSNEVEDKLWTMIIDASGKDNILSEKEFTKYIRKHYAEYEELEDTLTEYSKEHLEEIGAYEIFEERFLLGLISREKKIKSKVAIDLQKKIYGFKKYLRDFSLLSHREVNEVTLWKEYLIWAAYFGIAAKVYEQLKIVEPELEFDGMDIYTTILLTNNFSNHVQSTYNSATSSSSSGGGGSSFSGGGGGSFGGGSGGGIR